MPLAGGREIKIRRHAVSRELRGRRRSVQGLPDRRIQARFSKSRRSPRAAQCNGRDEWRDAGLLPELPCGARFLDRKTQARSHRLRVHRLPQRRGAEANVKSYIMQSRLCEY
jgi:hypothetical protein